MPDRDSGGRGGRRRRCTLQEEEEVWAREVGRTQASFGCWIEYGKGKGKREMRWDGIRRGEGMRQGNEVGGMGNRRLRAV